MNRGSLLTNSLYGTNRLIGLVLFASVNCVIASKSKKFNFMAACSKWLAILLILICAASTLGIYGLYRYIKPQLPNIVGLKEIKLQVPLSVYSQDGKLMARFGEKKRIPITIDETPGQLSQAFLAAEDDRFFSHPGVDYKGLLRAGWHLLLTGEKRQGGSTITMQLARNFFLTREKTFLRKIKEIFLALEIEQQLSKPEILELYLNKIYLGHRAYGVGAAAQVYYGKKIKDLNLTQWAMIAGLPKAPSRFNPLTNPERAIIRRNYILRRMRLLEFITLKEYEQAIKQPVTAKLQTYSIELTAPYAAEMVRETMVKRFGEDAYISGYNVYTTIDSRLQIAARNALHRASHEYDERHGYRGREGSIDIPVYSSPKELDQRLKPYPKIGDTYAGIVVSIDNQSISVYLDPSRSVEIPWRGLKWARKHISENSRGRAPRKAANIVEPGDIIRVRWNRNANSWFLAQIPAVAGALVSLNPIDGGIVALTGGFDFYQSKYNRVTQAKRQPGSGFKPILYTKALEEGYTAASIINDAPIVYVDPWTAEEWRPKNYSGKFYGPTRLRVALRKSRNLVSVRLLREIGIKKVVESAMRFGLPSDQIPRNLSMALGSGSATPLEMARVFSVFANGGFLIDPNYILRIETNDGEILEEAFPKTACPNCGELSEQNEIFARRVMSPEINYLMTSLLKDVVKRGTAIRVNQLGRSDLAGKTGTTNEQRDAWFNGYSPTMVTVVWVGFDSSKPLGNRETGSKAALPMWIYYTEEALKDVPDEEVDHPVDMINAQINPYSGFLASPSDPNAISEIFRAEYVPYTWGPAGRATPYAHSERIDPYTSEDSENSQIQSLF